MVRVFSVEHRAKLSAARKGYKMKPEHIIAMSKRFKGVKKKNWNPKSSHSGPEHYLWKGGKETEKVRRAFYQRQRVYKKRANGGSHTLDEWEILKAQYNFTCPRCGNTEPSIKLTEDHIVPVSKGGSNNIENIQPLCWSCNSSKKTNVIKYEPYVN